MNGSARFDRLGMRLRTAWSLRHADAVGSGVCVRGRIIVENVGRLVIEDRVQLSGVACPTHLVTGAGGSLVIGARTVVGHGSGIAATFDVQIGADVHIGSFCLLLDNDYHTIGAHDVPPPSVPVRIDDGARLASRVIVLRGSHIGAGARILAGSVVVGDIPAGATAGGVPARPIDGTP